MPSGISIRLTEDKKLNQVHFMLHDHFSCPKHSTPVNYGYALGDDVGSRDAKPKSNFHILVAVSKSELAGFCDFYFETKSLTHEKVLFLEDLYVRKKFRSTCVGQQLMQRLASICLQEQARCIRLHIPVWNPAREFYTRCGAKWNGIMINEWLEYEIDEQAIKILADKLIC